MNGELHVLRGICWARMFRVQERAGESEFAELFAAGGLKFRSPRHRLCGGRGVGYSIADDSR